MYDLHMDTETSEIAASGTGAFFGKAELKKFFMDRIEGHRKADELIHGRGWGNGKGCAIGCLFHRYDHAYGEEQSGVPRTILRLMDGLFESLPNDSAKEWPERCFAAIHPGADLSLVMAKWFVWMLVDAEDGIIKYAKADRTRKAIQDVADLYNRQASGEAVSISEFRNVRAYAADAADAAADAYAAYAADAYAAADAAAAYAADAYADAAAAYAAAADAYAADAYAAADADAYAAAAAAAAYAAAADAAAYAYAADAYAADAYAAADAAAAYAADAAAYADVRSQARAKQADKLIELLEAA